MLMAGLPRDALNDVCSRYKALSLIPVADLFRREDVLR
jgi:hypothetical protein